MKFGIPSDHASLSSQIRRFEMPSLVEDAVDVEGLADQLVEDAVGIQADLAHVLLADFRHSAADAGCLAQSMGSESLIIIFLKHAPNSTKPANHHT